MKTTALLCYLIIAGLYTTIQAQTFSSLLGEWEGIGTLKGQPAEFEMYWEQTLNDQFYTLRFRNNIPAFSFSMEAHGYYQVLDDGSISGYWFDSRGISFPISGSIEEKTIIIYWGTPEIEEGRTEYMVISEDQVKVTDYILRDGTFDQFGEAMYQPKKQ